MEVATDWWSWTFPLPEADLLEGLPVFEHPLLLEYVGTGMVDHADSMTASPSDWLHGGIARMRDALGGAPSAAFLVDPQTITTRPSEPQREHFVEGFLINAIRPSELAALIAMVDRWLDASSTDPRLIASLLGENDVFVAQEFESAAGYEPGEPYRLEGDRPQILFWFLRMLRAKVTAAQAAGCALVHVRYLYFWPQQAKQTHSRPPTD